MTRRSGLIAELAATAGVMSKVDIFFCEKCLLQQRVSQPIQEKVTYRGW